MIRVLVYNDICLNVDNDSDAAKLIADGARGLSEDEIAAYGMTGYESRVSPENTVVNADGTVTFTAPVAQVALEEAETADAALTAQINALREEMGQAILAGDEEWQAELKAAYQELLGIEEEE